MIAGHVMPDTDGIVLIQKLRATPDYAQVPIVMRTATSNHAVRLRALEAGATDFLPKSSSRIEIKIKLRNLVTLARAIRQQADDASVLADRIHSATQALRTAKEEMILRLSLAVEYRDNDTGEHTLRVARYSKMIAEELQLPAEQCRKIYLAAPLHDVGKVAIPDHVLLKPGPLDPAELALMRSHTSVGERILGDGSCDLIRLAAEIAGHHHERWDGRGYPRQIAGEAIPLSARIVAVADVFDAMTSERPYKRTMPVSKALKVLLDERGKHFDPRCVDAFLAAYAQSHPTQASVMPATCDFTGHPPAMSAAPTPACAWAASMP